MAKNQEQLCIRLNDAVFARMVVDVRSMIESMPSEQKAGIDGEFLTAIAEQPNEILKCAMICSSFISTVQPNSPSHAAAEAPHQTSRGDAIRMKMTAVSPTAA